MSATTKKALRRALLPLCALAAWAFAVAEPSPALAQYETLCDPKLLDFDKDGFPDTDKVFVGGCDVSNIKYRDGREAPPTPDGTTYPTRGRYEGFVGAQQLILEQRKRVWMHTEPTEKVDTGRVDKDGKKIFVFIPGKTTEVQEEEKPWRDYIYSENGEHKPWHVVGYDERYYQTTTYNRWQDQGYEYKPVADLGAQAAGLGYNTTHVHVQPGTNSVVAQYTIDIASHSETTPLERVVPWASPGETCLVDREGNPIEACRPGIYAYKADYMVPYLNDGHPNRAEYCDGDFDDVDGKDFCGCQEVPGSGGAGSAVGGAPAIIYNQCPTGGAGQASQSGKCECDEPRRAGYCNDVVETTVAVNGQTYTFDQPKLRFQYCDYWRILGVLNPLAGVEVDSGWRGRMVYLYDPKYGPRIMPGVLTNEKGFFRLDYPYPQCMDFVDKVYATVRFTNLDPERKTIAFGGQYTVTQDVRGGADRGLARIGLTEPFAAFGSTGRFDAYDPRLSVGDPYVSCRAGNTFDGGSTRSVNFGIDVAYLVGTAEMRNPRSRAIVRKGQEDAITLAPDEVGDAIPIDDSKETATRYTYTDVSYPGPTGNAPTPHDFADAKQDKGLLRQINRYHLFALTDLYAISDDGRVLYARKGLRQNEVAGLEFLNDVQGYRIEPKPNCPEQPVDTLEEMAQYDDGEGNVTNCLYDARFNFQDIVPNRMILGRSLEVVAVNRATGYMGTLAAAVDFKDSTPSVKGADGKYFQPGPSRLPQIIPGNSIGRPKSDKDGDGIDTGNDGDVDLVMRPPNLKIEVRRTRSDTTEFLVGSEGKALGGGTERDLHVEIYTDWSDWDGTALPPEMDGFTGRVATVDDKGEYSDIREFEIRPGRHLTVLELPVETNLSKHYYIHVFGMPKSEIAAPQRSNTQPEYQGDLADLAPNKTLGESSRGASDDIDPAMLMRPSHYVPIKVPIYDEEATQYARELNVKAPPVYQWVYRPEMQFSLLELDELEWRAADGGSVNLIDPNRNAADVIQLSGASSIYYDITGPKDDPLPALGQPGELVFAIGKTNGVEVRADLGIDTVAFLDGSTEERLTADDLSTFQLYQNTDKGNVLWAFDELRSVDITIEGNLGGCYRNAQLLANAVPDNLRVTWSIIKQEPSGDEAIDCKLGPKTGHLECTEESGKGRIRVRVEADNVPDVNDVEWIPVGCDQCESGNCASVGTGSVHIEIPLGQGLNGGSGGYLLLDAETMSADLATPNALEFTTLMPGAHAVRVEDPAQPGQYVLRQAVTPNAFTDITVDTPTQYTVTVYPIAAKGPRSDDLYPINPGIPPLSTWVISSPAADRLHVSRTEAEHAFEYEFEHDDATDAWSLSEGVAGTYPDQTFVTKNTIQRSAAPGGDRYETLTITGLDVNGDEEVASVRRIRYHPYAWGEEIVEVVEDHGGLDLTTTTTFHESGNGEGKVASVTNPDGSWVKYEYDAEDRRTSVARPWLDTAIDALPADVHLTTYDYAPVDPRDTPTDENRSSPRTVTETIQGVVTSRTYYAFLRSPDGGETHIVERVSSQNAAYGDATNLRTETTFTNDYDPFPGQIKTQREPDGTLRTITREYGRYSGDVFTAAPGLVTGAVREISTQGTSTAPSGIPFKTTQTRTIFDASRRVLRTEEYVYTGSGVYELIGWKKFTPDPHSGRLTSTVASNGATTSTTWGCCAPESTTDEEGIVTTTYYDDAGRVDYTERAGIITSYIYDGAGRVLTTTRSAGSGSLALSLSSSTTYDGAGRIDTSTDEQSLVTSYIYDEANRETTVTRPGGGTTVTHRYVDGQVESVIGTGVTDTFTTHGVNPDGTRWTETHRGTADSLDYERTTVDLLGRTLSVEVPKFGGGTETRTSHYNAKGQLDRTSEPGQAATLYRYDSLGNPTRQGLDTDGDDQLTNASADRITETETFFEPDATQPLAWWRTTLQHVYPTLDEPDKLTVSEQREKLIGLALNVRSETQSFDIHGNQTTVRVEQPSTGTRVVRTDAPDSTIDEVTTTEQGRLTSQTTKTGITTRYGYDALGRRVSQSFPRTGTSTLHVVTKYNALGQVESQSDADGNKTTFAYDPTSGQRVLATNAQNMTTRWDHDERGNIVHTWGDVPYPIENGYDEHGRRTTMKTYRSGDFSGETWPGGTGDVTTWEYDEATGLLTSKIDAANESVDYTYTTGGKLHTRTWARNVTTTYTYDPTTAELTQIDYADTTPDISYTYDRLGRIATITDAVGSRTMAYDPDTLQLLTETIDGQGPFDGTYDVTLTRKYQDGTEENPLPGRDAGYHLGDGSTHDVTYGYQADGRFKSVAWDINGTEDSATYTYVTGSPLLAGMTTESGQETTYGYEPKRDLKTQVANKFNGSLVSQYDYKYDTLGRRTSVKNSGSAFAQPAFNVWGYDDRNQLTSSERYLGTDLADVSQPVIDERRTYDYDPIGNRISTTSGASDSETYLSNELNQYLAVTGGEGVTFGYDADGNTTSKTAGGVETRYVFNGENRLVRVEPVSPSDGDVRVSMVYDHLGRRVEKSVATYGGGVWSTSDERVFVYDGWNLVREISGAGASVPKDHVWGLDLSRTLDAAGGVGGLLSVVDASGASYHPGYNANGNVEQTIDGTGTLAASYRYDSFGVELTAGPSAAESRFSFSTKYRDAETRLSDYGLRYLDASLGRWGRRDPIEEAGGSNLYGFVGNRSVDRYDLVGKRVVVQEVKGPEEGPRKVMLNVDGVVFADCKLKITPLQLNVARDVITFGIQDIWSGTFGEIEVEAKVQLRVAKKEPAESTTETRFLFRQMTAAGTTQHYVNWILLQRDIVGNSTRLRRTSSHELGHVMSLDHPYERDSLWLPQERSMLIPRLLGIVPKPSPNNLMHQSKRTSGTVLEQPQIEKILANAARLNTSRFPAPRTN